MKFLQGTLDFDNSKLVYHIVLLDKCIYLYLGTAMQTFDHLAYAIQTQFEEQPTPATLISAGEDDEFPERLAEKLSLKLKVPVTLSVNVPVSDPMSEAKLSQTVFLKLVPIILSA